MVILTGLLVDDNPKILQILAQFCEHEGMCFDLAENGKCAIELLKKGNYDFVLTDVQMPILNGFGLAQYCHDSCFGLPVFLMSGDLGNFQSESMNNPAIQGTFLKPHDLKSMFREIREKITHI
ncbi:MAG: response regulator [Promethearchaeota archaeon]